MEMDAEIKIEIETANAGGLKIALKDVTRLKGRVTLVQVECRMNHADNTARSSVARLQVITRISTWPAVSTTTTTRSPPRLFTRPTRTQAAFSQNVHCKREEVAQVSAESISARPNRTNVPTRSHRANQTLQTANDVSNGLFSSSSTPLNTHKPTKLRSQ